MELGGIWGGKTGRERRTIRRRWIADGTITPSTLDRANTGPSGPVQCGTRSGYNTHRRIGEEPCQECRDANTEYVIDYRNRHGNRAKDIECGTHAGYRKHLRDGTPACQPCLDANSARVANDRMAGAA